jgi:hypothetical protein
MKTDTLVSELLEQKPEATNKTNTLTRQADNFGGS